MMKILSFVDGVEELLITRVGEIISKNIPHVDAEWIASRRQLVKYYLKKNWCVDGIDLEEITQETMVAALQSFRNYEARNNAEPGTFLLGIAKNVAQTYFRKRGRYQRRTAPLEFANSIGDVFYDQAEANELARMLKEKLALLPQKYVQVLELVFYKGFKEGEIAKKLGLPRDKVYNYKSDGLKRLRKLCKKDPLFKTLLP